MGQFVASPPPRVLVVAAAAGRMKFSDGSEKIGSGKLWLTADKQLVVATNGADGNVERRAYDVESVQMSPTAGRFTLEDGRHIDVAIKSCGCGMGAAGNAALMDAPHQIAMVKTPEWVTAS